LHIAPASTIHALVVLAEISLCDLIGEALITQTSVI